MNSQSVNDNKAMESTRHSTRATILSVLFMGLGQIYNRQYVKGITYALIELYVIIFMTGYFAKSFWGLITLGETPSKLVKGKLVQGDHSIFLLINGLIALILFIFFVLFYVYNVLDARKIGKLRDLGKEPMNLKQSLQNLWDKGFPFLLLTPATIFTVFITILPLLFGILIAFTNYSAPHHIPDRSLVEWVGFNTFIELFTLKTWSTTFYGVAAWTIVWAILSTVTTFFAGLFVAILVNHHGIKFKGFWRTIFIIPWAVPQFISILIFRNMFNGEFGPVNGYIKALGFDPIPWLSDPTLAKMTILLVNIWFGLPYYMALMSGVLTGIPKDLYEAAEVDGASPRQKFWSITLPLVLYATAPLLIMAFAFNFNNFNLIYLLTDGNPVQAGYRFAGSTDILISWIYKMTIQQNQFNIASAVSILMFFVIAAISIWNFRRTRSFKEEDMI
jgi:arabinogalactan oligomer/maltooligosaccharide transport system permease protein